MSSKLVPMNAALDAIRDGMSITAGGFAHFASADGAATRAH
ncbi:hypothetical protein [Burkholderia multivorans]|nr:hypothetical protein [Burkholderia multivorans]